MKEQTNGADAVVKVIRVYASGRVRAARPGANDKPASGAPWGRPRAQAVPEEVAGQTEPARVKDPKKVAAGKARAAKAAQAKAAAEKKKAKPKATKKPPAKKAEKPKAPRGKKSAAATRLAHAMGIGTAGAKAKSKTQRTAGPDAKVVVAFRVSRAHKAKLAKLGGVDFIRDRIERAAIPARK